MRENVSLRCRKLRTPMRCKSVIVTDKERFLLTNPGRSPRPKSGFVRAMCKFYSGSVLTVGSGTVDDLDDDDDDVDVYESCRRLSPTSHSVQSQDSGFSDGQPCNSQPINGHSPTCDKDSDDAPTIHPTFKPTTQSSIQPTTQSSIQPTPHSTIRPTFQPTNHINIQSRIQPTIHPSNHSERVRMSGDRVCSLQVCFGNY